MLDFSMDNSASGLLLGCLLTPAMLVRGDGGQTGTVQGHRGWMIQDYSGHKNEHHSHTCSSKYFVRGRSYRQTNRQTDRQTDRQKSLFEALTSVLTMESQGPCSLLLLWDRNLRWPTCRYTTSSPSCGTYTPGVRQLTCTRNAKTHLQPQPYRWRDVMLCL